MSHNKKPKLDPELADLLSDYGRAYVNDKLYEGDGREITTALSKIATYMRQLKTKIRDEERQKNGKQ